jgi:Protein of unknown function (DUF3592)
MQRVWSVAWYSKTLPPFGAFSLFAVIGAIAFAIGANWHQRLDRLMSTGMRASGEVVSVERSHGTNSHFPVFRYRDNRGVVVEVKSAESSESLRVGDPVVVLYEPSDPYNAQILQIIQSGLGAYLLMLFGVLLALGGASIAYKQIKYERRAKETRPAA